MTLALVMAITCLIIWGVQKGNTNLKKQSQKRSTKTNLILQEKIIDATWEILNNELGAMPKSEFDLPNLYKKYNIPTGEDLAGTAYHKYHADSIDDLCFEMARKELRRRGYAFSYNYNDSTWQENEQRYKANNENKKKNPWL